MMNIWGYSYPQIIVVGFHLSPPMEYVNNAPYLCMATNTVSYLANEAIDQLNITIEHSMEQAAE